jgi:hypothetical protein
MFISRSPAYPAISMAGKYQAGRRSFGTRLEADTGAIRFRLMVRRTIWRSLLLSFR